MKIVFVANFMNHHQLPFCEEMNKYTNNNFVFVANEPLPNEQKKLGYTDMNDLNFVIKAYVSKDCLDKALKEIIGCDMVIFGTCPNYMIEERAKTGKPFIFYSERFFKKGTYRRFIPTTKAKINERMLKYSNYPCSIICSSAFLPYDLSLLHANFNIYKWGYFPKAHRGSINDLLKKKNNKTIKILWVARFIKLKHPEIVIKLANCLKKKGYNFEINLIGRGPLQKKIKRQIKINKLDKFVILKGSMDSNQVRENMDKSDILLFTSDYHEGWGAVVNEAMSSATVPIVSSAVGSAPYLIKHGETGYIYKNNNLNQLIYFTELLIKDSKKRLLMAKNAYNHIEFLWNYEIATKRLFELIEGVMNKKELNFIDGPCSKAEIIKPRTYWKNGNYKKQRRKK